MHKIDKNILHSITHQKKRNTQEKQHKLHAQKKTQHIITHKKQHIHQHKTQKQDISHK